MKHIITLLAAVVLVSILNAATPAQIEAWKKKFPIVSPGRSPQLHKMTSPYLAQVKLATAASVETTVSTLLAKADQDLATLKAKAKLLTEPKVKKKTPATAEWFDTHEQINWFSQELIPYLRKMAGK